MALPPAYVSLEKVVAAFNAVRAYHAEERFSNGTSVSVDCIPPNRIKIVPSTGGGEIIIGNDFWVNERGTWHKMPSFVARMVEGKIDQYRHLAPQNINSGSVKDLGIRLLAGKRLHAYSYVASGTPATMWVAANNLPVQVVTTSRGITTTITYSYGNVVIGAP